MIVKANVKLLKQGTRRLYNPSQYSHTFSVTSLAQWLFMQQRLKKRPK
jgi:hypothetical protein